MVNYGRDAVVWSDGNKPWLKPLMPLNHTALMSFKLGLLGLGCLKYT